MAQHEDPTRPFKQLTPADAQAVDAAVSRLNLTPGTEGQQADPARVQRARAIFSLVSLYPTGDPSTDLVSRTLAKVDEARQRERFRRQVEALSRGGSPGWRWTDMAAAAAVLIAAFSLLWPSMGQMRSQSRRVACSQNLAAAGQGIGSFAADHQGQMLRYGSIAAPAAAPGNPWYEVGRDNADQPQQAGQAPRTIRSNSAQLYLLIRRGYVNPAILACPENANAVPNVDPRATDWPKPAAVSYSYQNQFTRRPLTLDQASGMAILADKNPLLMIRIDPRTGRATLIFRKDLPQDAASAQHGQAGQNILRGDGSAVWSDKPWLPNSAQAKPSPAGQDNIWLIEGLDHYDGHETPEQMNDSHLVP
ncbi:MAG: hypothetical protein IT441_05425 [Phycisphaeraceae bacterium]|nr:hypothetical protein [Phycisphaeraceae bacterium]